jgi:mannose-6-phosphate isomerase-like protein (cupin superfamily)
MALNSSILGNTAEPFRVRGIHGGVGDLYWKRLVTGGHMYGDWESFEYARLEIGASVGRHKHSRTEEIYIVVSGTGSLNVDGKEIILQAGDSVITPLNGIHSFCNTGSVACEFLVVETVPPKIAELLPYYSPTIESEH